MGDEISNLIEKRQVLRAAAEAMAEGLTGNARAQFLASTEDIINKVTPAPGKTHMRSYLKTRVID